MGFDIGALLSAMAKGYTTGSELDLKRQQLQSNEAYKKNLLQLQQDELTANAPYRQARTQKEALNTQLLQAKLAQLKGLGAPARRGGGSVGGGSVGMMAEDSGTYGPNVYFDPAKKKPTPIGTAWGKEVEKWNKEFVEFAEENAIKKTPETFARWAMSTKSDNNIAMVNNYLYYAKKFNYPTGGGIGPAFTKYLANPNKTMAIADAELGGSPAKTAPAVAPPTPTGTELREGAAMTGAGETMTKLQALTIYRDLLKANDPKAESFKEQYGNLWE